MDCQLIKLPLLYLGIPVGANPRKMETWRPIVEKEAKRLKSWKHKSLSFARRLCLINSVTSSFPLFYMALLKIPYDVVNHIEKLQKVFLWREDESGRKTKRVSWRKICWPKNVGIGCQGIEKVS